MEPIQRIHLFGASGSGTTTLGEALAHALPGKHFDTDSYFWLPTEPPFQQAREREERRALMEPDLRDTPACVLSGSLGAWADFAIPYFDLAVYLWIPPEIRMRRLARREHARYGTVIDDPETVAGKTYREFMAWAAGYDTGGPDMRSRAYHEEWMRKLPCPLLRLEGDRTVEERVEAVRDWIWKRKCT